jgi:DNA-directed RNA polymerase specialized sigma24 family protein
VERLSQVRSEAGLYERNRRELTRFATTLVGVSDAGDVVSDALESLLRSGQLLKARNPSALMHRAVFNKARSMRSSFFRRRARERRFEQELGVTHPELRPDVITAVIKLSPWQRACIYLTYWDDLAPTQIVRRTPLVGCRRGLCRCGVLDYCGRCRTRRNRGSLPSPSDPEHAASTITRVPQRSPTRRHPGPCDVSSSFALQN